MARIVALDAGPLGDAGKAPGNAGGVRCRRWLRRLLDSGAVIVVPEIADDEVRRELIRADATAGLLRLDQLTEFGLDYLPITTAALRRAAEFWAIVRNLGLPTAHPQALDGDAILAAQASLCGGPEDEVLIATTNVGHLSRFPGIDARLWDQILH